MRHAPLITDRREFEKLVEVLLREDSQGSYGKLHLVCIQPMIEGHDWHHLLPKATVIAERIMAQHLGAEDACLRLSEGQYLLLFPRLNDAEGHIRAMAISQEIRQHLSGSEEQELEVVAQVVALSQIKTVDDDDLIRRMDAAARLAAQPHGLRLSVDYQPIWDGHHQATIGNRARIRRDFGGQTMYEAATMFAGLNDPLAVDINHSLSGSASHYPHGKGLLFLPVMINEHTLAEPDGLKRFAEESLHHDGHRVVFELVLAIAELSRPIIRETVTLFRNSGGRVGARLMPDRDTAKFLRDSGVDFVCINENQAVSAGLTTSAIHALITLVAHDAADLGHRLCLWNAATAEDIKRAMGLGFQLFTGQPIGSTTPLPTTPRAFPAINIYS